MNTTKLSSGLAFAPDKDLKLFSEMAAQGKHLSGFGAFGHGWAFTDGPKEEAIFALAYEKNPNKEYFDLFSASGWQHVLSAADLHIFKAPPGTTPIHTMIESQRDELMKQRNKFAFYSVVTLLLLILVMLVFRFWSLNEWVEYAILAIAPIPVVYTVMPLAGYEVRLRKLK